MNCYGSDLTSPRYDENLASSPFALGVARRANDLEKSCGGTMGVGLNWWSRSPCVRPRPARAVATMRLVELGFEIANGIVKGRSGLLAVWWWWTKPGAVDHLLACCMSVVACVTSCVPRQEIRSKQRTWCSTRGLLSFEKLIGFNARQISACGPGSGVRNDHCRKLKNI